MRNEAQAKVVPRCGDLWEFPDGRYMLIDYVNTFVGGTFSSGLRIGFNSRNKLTEYITEHYGRIISYWEDKIFTHCDQFGWTNSEISKLQSADYICEIISKNKLKLFNKLDEKNNK